MTAGPNFTAKGSRMSALLLVKASRGICIGTEWYTRSKHDIYGIYVFVSLGQACTNPIIAPRVQSAAWAAAITWGQNEGVPNGFFVDCDSKHTGRWYNLHDPTRGIWYSPLVDMNFGGVDAFNLFYYVLVWDSFKNLYSNGLFAHQFQAHSRTVIFKIPL